MASVAGLNTDAVTPETPVADADPEHGVRLSVIDRMRSEGFRFNFYQAVHLLERRRAKAQRAGGTSGAGANPVRFRPSTSLSFPATDVARIDVPESPEEAATVVATFMGLYGVDAPLPEFFYERLAVDEASAVELRDFLDIFANRIYALFYQAWKRVRAELDPSRSHAQRFLALTGLAHAGTASNEARRVEDSLVSFAGHLAPRTRGAEGLACVLGGLLGVPVRVEQHVPRWVRISRSLGVGRGARLSGSAMLGDRIFDVSGKFRIWLGPMHIDRYLGLLPGGSDARVLASIVRAYVPGYLDHDVALQFYAEGLPTARLGNQQCRLGLTAAIGKPLERILTRIVREL
jgi:type VI secretion system protein ImpH